MVLAFCAAMPAQAQLKWLDPEQSFKTKPADTKVQTGYTFTNLGAYAVTIQAVKASCGCTTTSLKKKTYEPGEGGVINTTFDIGNRRGTQTKRITVSTDDPKKSNRSLVLKVEIPRVVTVKPQLVSWSVDEAADAKVVDIAAAEGATIEIVEATPSNDRVAIEQKEVAEKTHYEVALSPATTAEKFRGFLRLKVKINGDTVKEYRIFYRVIPPLPARPARS